MPADVHFKDLEVVDESKRGVKVLWKNDREIWLPKSACQFDQPTDPDPVRDWWDGKELPGIVSLKIPHWLAVKNRMLY